MYVIWIRMRYRGLINESNKKKYLLLVIVLLLISITKDFIIVMIVMHFLFATTLSTYGICYSSAVFTFYVGLFGLPFTVFHFAKARYAFDFSKKNNIFENFRPFLSVKTKFNEMKEVNKEEKYFNECYQLLASIKCSDDEFTFLKDSTSKHLQIFSIILAVIICLVHCVFQLLFQIDDFSFCEKRGHYNETVNSTLSIILCKSVIGITCLNSLMTSLVFSALMVYIVLWKASILSEWKKFNANENAARTTLIKNRPQGIAIWWKIRQTLNFFSSSDLCMSVLIGNMVFIVCFLLIVIFSVLLFVMTSPTLYDAKSNTVILMLTDNILIYVWLLLVGEISVLITQENTRSRQIIELKQMNVAYELSTLMNLEQDGLKRQTIVQRKIRIKKSCLLLLKELTAAMRNLEKRNSSKCVITCLGVATLLIVASVYFAVSF